MEKKATFKKIKANQLKKKIEAGGNFELIDVLNKNSFDVKHVPNSKSIPVSEIENRAPKELPDKNKEIIVYCASKTCQASPTAAKKLVEMGYTKVIDFEDGLAGWQDAEYKFA